MFYEHVQEPYLLISNTRDHYWFAYYAKWRNNVYSGLLFFGNKYWLIHPFLIVISKYLVNLFFLMTDIRKILSQNLIWNKVPKILLLRQIFRSERWLLSNPCLRLFMCYNDVIPCNAISESSLVVAMYNVVVIGYVVYFYSTPSKF